MRRRQNSSWRERMREERHRPVGPSGSRPRIRRAGTPALPSDFQLLVSPLPNCARSRRRSANRTSGNPPERKLCVRKRRHRRERRTAISRFDPLPAPAASFVRTASPAIFGSRRFSSRRDPPAALPIPNGAILAKDVQAAERLPVISRNTSSRSGSSVDTSRITTPASRNASRIASALVRPVR